MDIFFPISLGKRLREGTLSKIPSRKSRSYDISTDSRRRTREYQRAACATLVQTARRDNENEISSSQHTREKATQRHALKSSENAYHFFGERKGSMNIAIRDLLQVILGNIREWFPNPNADIPNSHSDGCVRPMRLDLFESRTDLLGRIPRHGERGSLFIFIKKWALVGAPTEGKVEDEIGTLTDPPEPSISAASFFRESTPRAMSATRNPLAAKRRLF